MTTNYRPIKGDDGPTVQPRKGNRCADCGDYLVQVRTGFDDTQWLGVDPMFPYLCKITGEMHTRVAPTTTPCGCGAYRYRGMAHSDTCPQMEDPR